ncbi:hypothetical protein I7I53_03377 [Histoplasma capsulatum var. duboisii H88]|uniref:Uncharacterized protein n=1 Tax=Ajellomyces capsulatus (strain H88) TaxID=544711 RepID=A0A8A1LNG0_AJEC8|nr:hypothetical protein I7I53_03377 [Histoplasma capsulatum var. duboisii H88]
MALKEKIIEERCKMGAADPARHGKKHLEACNGSQIYAVQQLVISNSGPVASAKEIQEMVWMRSRRFTPRPRRRCGLSSIWSFSENLRIDGWGRD